MTSEEIKALGLLKKGRYRITIEDDFAEGLPDSIHLQECGWISHECIRAIERVMPGLPSGWTWHGDYAQEVIGGKMVRALWMKEGCMMNCQGDGRPSDRPIPAPVAKALVEVWERAQ